MINRSLVAHRTERIRMELFSMQQQRDATFADDCTAKVYATRRNPNDKSLRFCVLNSLNLICKMFESKLTTLFPTIVHFSYRIAEFLNNSSKLSRAQIREFLVSRSSTHQFTRFEYQCRTSRLSIVAFIMEFQHLTDLSRACFSLILYYY